MCIRDSLKKDTIVCDKKLSGIYIPYNSKTFEPLFHKSTIMKTYYNSYYKEYLKYSIIAVSYTHLDVYKRQNYDSMIAKLITTAQTREEAIAKMKRALDEFYIEGVKLSLIHI